MKDVVKCISLEYPRIDGKVNCIEIELMDVRAADDIRISYDFDRDGWVIKQASIFWWDGGDKECNADWKEVAFVQAWAREDLDIKEKITGNRQD